MNLLSQNGGKRRRLESQSARRAVLTGVIENVLSDLSIEDQRAIIDMIEYDHCRGEPVSTSVEELIKWTNTSKGPNLGHLVATGMPVLCYGLIVNDDKLWDQVSPLLGKRQRPPQNERILAHGLTEGSVYMKVERDANNNISRVKTFTVCNHVLWILAGKLKENGNINRDTTRWPFKHKTNNKKRGGKGNVKAPKTKKPSGKSTRQQSKGPRLPSHVHKIVNHGNITVKELLDSGSKIDGLSHLEFISGRLTVSMLKDFLLKEKVSGVTSGMRKPALVTLYMDYILNNGNRQNVKDIIKSYSNRLD